MQQHLVAPISATTSKVVLHESEEGFAVSCPALPGCWSQGVDEDEAIANIREAIREHVEAHKYLHCSIQPH